MLYKINLDDVNITDLLKQQVGTKSLELKALLPFLIDLTTDERKVRAKIGPKRRDFINEMRDVVNDHPELFPAAFDKANFLKAIAQEKYLEDFMVWAKDFLELLDDTHLDVGCITLDFSFEAYKYLKAHSGNDELKKKMKGYFDKADKEEEPEPPTT